MKTHKKLLETLEKAQTLLLEVVQNGNGRLDGLRKQVDVLQDVVTHVEHELAQGRATKTKKTRVKAI